MNSISMFRWIEGKRTDILRYLFVAFIFPLGVFGIQDATVWGQGESDGVSQPDSTNGTVLRWQLKQGERYESTLSQSTKITSEVDQQKRIVESDVSLKLDWFVENVNDEQIVILQTLKSLQLETISPTTGKRIQIDSDNPPARMKKLEGEINKQLEPFIGTEFKLTMSRRGEVIDVSLAEATLEKLRNVPGSLQVRELFTPDGLKNLYGKSIMQFPGEPVSNGFTWKQQSTKETPLGQLVETVDYVANRPDGQANFEIGIKVTVDQVEKPDPNDIRVDASGKQIAGVLIDRFNGQGTLVMDAKNEFIRRSEIRNVMASSRPYREQIMRTEVETTVVSVLSRMESDAAESDQSGNE